MKVTDERSKLLSLLSSNEVLFDTVVIAPSNLQLVDHKNFYLNSLKDIRLGLTYFIVHLAYDDSESRAMMGQNEPFGAAWRQADFDIVTSPEFQQALRNNHITVIRWRDLQRLVNPQ